MNDRRSDTLATDLAIAAGAAIVYALMSPLAASTPVNGGLGPDGGAFGEMVRHFTLKGGDETARLSPLFPALAWLPYLFTGNVVKAFAILNRVALGALVFGACRVLGAHRVDAKWKIFVAVQFALLIAFTRFAVFLPVQPRLCALAMLMLAVASCGSPNWMAIAASHTAAVMTMPVGLVAPLYGTARSLRLREPPGQIALRFLPAVVIWMGVQWWARGGVSGALHDFSPGSLTRGLEIWRDPVFDAFATYFLVTAAGALSVIVLARLDTSWRALIERPEIVMLGVATAVYLVEMKSEALLATGFLAPFWVLVFAAWLAADSGGHGRRAWWWWFAAGSAITIATQRPFAKIDLTAFYVDWNPYDVLRGAAHVQYPQLWERWVPRFAVAAVAVWLVAIAGRASRRHEPSEPEELVPASAPPRAHRGEALLAAVRAQLREWATATIPLRDNSFSHRAAYVYAVLLGAITAYFLFGMPIQLTDSFANLLGIQGTSAWGIFRAELGGTGYLRPLLQVQLKVVYDLAHGHYFIWYRSVQAIQVLAALLLTVSILNIRNARDLAVLPLCLAAFLGIHTFAGAIREAFPINTFLTLVLCCLLAVRIAQHRGGALVDAAAAALLAFSVLTLETGVLVWVIFVTAHLIGYKGITRRTVVIVSAVLAGYLVLRFALLHVGPPGLNERPSGFGFRELEPREIQARFGGNPFPFYVYNYFSAVLTVLFAEPRGGIWELFADVSNRTFAGWRVINVAVSTLTTVVIAAYVVKRMGRWLHREIDDADRLVLLFLVLLPANALLCYVYVKDVIMSPAGALYALAAFVAVRAVLTPPSSAALSRAAVAATLLLAVLSAGWGWRLLGIHYNLRNRANSVRADWAFEDLWEAKNHIQIDTPEAAALKQTLMDDAIWRRPAPPRLARPWLGEFFDTTQ